MTDSPSDAGPSADDVDEQKAAFLLHLDGFIDDLERSLTSAKTLRAELPQDLSHAYVQGVTIAGQVRRHARFRGEHMAATVYQAPASVSLPRLAKALDFAINTLRARIMLDRADPSQQEQMREF